jgi:hypothetical protein
LASRGSLIDENHREEVAMARAINSTAMSVDGVTDVADWYVFDGDHDAASRAQFEGAG